MKGLGDAMRTQVVALSFGNPDVARQIALRLSSVQGRYPPMSLTAGRYPRQRGGGGHGNGQCAGQQQQPIGQNDQLHKIQGLGMKRGRGNAGNQGRGG